MGSFFTNVQVRVGAGGRERVVAALRAMLGADGMDEVDAGEDRSIIVRSADAGGWVAIYDSQAESQDGRVLDAIAEAASRAVGDHAFTALVHDSDVLALALFREGALQDRFDSFPEYFEPLPPEQKAAVRGDASRWAPILPEGVSEGDLGAVFGREDGFAERTLGDVARLLRVDPGRAMVGYRYLEDDVRADPDNVVLRFRARKRPGWERDAEGPPRFAPSPGVDVPVMFAEGDPLRLSIATANQGGAFDGLRVVIWGSALDDGLVAIDELEHIVGDVQAGAPRASAPPVDGRDAEGRALRVLDLPEQTVPAGPAQTDFPAGGDFAGWMAAQNRARVHVNAIGRVLRAGEGTLQLGLMASGHPSAQASLTHRVRVEAPLWEPLRVAPGHPLAPRSMALRPLSGAVAQVALAVVREGARADVGAEALGVFEAVFRASGYDGVEVSVFHADAARRPTVEKHPGWPADLTAALADSHLLSVTAYRDAEPEPDLEALLRRRFEAAPRPPGIQIGGRLLGAVDERPEALVIFAGVGLDAPSEATDALVAMLEELAARGALSQATWSPAGWAPTFDVTSSPYETACGIHGCGSDRAYTDRWLRWPGRARLFLGPSLLAHLDRAALDAVAAVSDGPHGAWLTRRPEVDRSAWEAALGPVLPSARDARSTHAR